MRLSGAQATSTTVVPPGASKPSASVTSWNPDGSEMAACAGAAPIRAASAAASANPEPKRASTSRPYPGGRRLRKSLADPEALPHPSTRRQAGAARQGLQHERVAALAELAPERELPGVTR